MFKPITTATLTLMTALTIGLLPSHAQSSSAPTPTDASLLLDLNRAENLARQAAEAANGGLGNYRAESSMYGPASQAPYKDNGDGTVTFTFKGHKPDSDVSTVESVVTVARDGSKITVDYNGPIRSTSR